MSENMETESLWDETIDDIALSQATNEIECEYLFGELSLSQLSVFDMGHLDLGESLTVDSMIDTLEDNFECEQEETARFAFVEDPDVSNLITSTESKNTRKNTNWAFSVFMEWRKARMATKGTVIPELALFDTENINSLLGKFVIEARKKDGSPYPPRSLYMITVGLLRYMRENGNHRNFLDEKNSDFYEFRKQLSARMAQLTTEDVGSHVKQAEPISIETENKLWELGLLGIQTAKAIVNTVFFYNCKLFGLRAVDEHRQLSVDQFELGTDQEGKFIKFSGRANKTYKGGLNQRHITAKELKHHFAKEAFYEIYKVYIQCVKEKGSERFYLRPLENGENGSVRFSSQPIGVNKLSSLLKSMCTEANIPGFFTNHSGKRTCATSLYQAGIPEQEIMRRTGHRSVESIRKYKRPSSEMLHEVSGALEAGIPSASGDEVEETPNKKIESEAKEHEQKLELNFSCTINLKIFSLVVVAFS